MLTPLLDAAALSCVLICLYSWLKRRSRHALGELPYPSGPKGLPLVGNTFDMPGSEEWEKARQWGEQYGVLVFVRNIGTPYLFVSSFETAFDIFEKRGSKYSTRPENVMFKLIGPGSRSSCHMETNSGDRDNSFISFSSRRLSRTITNYRRNARTSSSLRCSRNLQTTLNIMKVAYGYQVDERNDPYIELVEKAMDALPGAMRFYLVNTLPILQYLPEWFPGAQFLTIAKEGRELSRQMRSKPFNLAKELIANGKGSPSMTCQLLEQNTDAEGRVSNEALIAKTAAVSYAAGADTTVAALLTFMLAMVLHPEAMRRGQEELDRVIGKDNLPTMEDKPNLPYNLPYINAICNEVLRYEPVTPLAVAHCASEDDAHKGFFIPAGTTVLANVWAMTRDPKEYPEPDKFKPERWLPVEGGKVPLDVSKVAFGFGRRICPGRHFAENDLFICVASTLASFDIQQALDKESNPIIPSNEFVSNFIRHPTPLKCRIFAPLEKNGRPNPSSGRIVQVGRLINYYQNVDTDLVIMK